ncbi:MAG: ferrous iron transport protein B [Anaerolineae bacterium]|jgi:ferrous iron transport protein B|nr:ferrous iron transport protein B [Anaerolineae bacterium]MBT7074703.1 ferrous iron transport protein B [Anaerolineae bacterium]MBT7782422.1 ferrous iron transport protein B [Anaerolineae bacterium]
MSHEHKHAYTQREGFTIDYGREAEHEIVKIQEEIAKYAYIEKEYPSRWLAIKLLEEDSDIKMRLQVLEGGKGILAIAEKSIAHLEKIYDDDVDVIIADHRYGWINGLVKETVKRTYQDRLTGSDKVDRIVTHRLLGIPIFLLAMWSVFKLTADVSAPYLDWVDATIGGPITNWIVAIIRVLGLGSTWVESLFVNGIIAGVGGVMVFVPVMMFLYLSLALLEDSGYMARAAFVMDRLMHVLGLHGKSFLPMLVGFGCTVPALYATRTLENEKDRILTGLLVPFMSCGARLPVYVLFAAIFFPENAGAVIFGLYFLGILTAIILGITLKNTLFKDKEDSTFVMELPPYRLPTLRGIWFHIWERTGSFVRKAWTIIMVTSIILWFLMAIPVRGGGSFAQADIKDSAFATVSKAISPALAPLGFDSWETTSALLTGFVAKEVVVSTMGQVYAINNTPDAIEEETEATTFFEDVGEILTTFMAATGDTIKSIPLIVGINLFEEEAEEEPTALMQAVRDGFEESSHGHSALAAMAFMVFVLIYTPCVAAVAAEKQELGMKWTWVSIIGQLVLAWLMAFVVFQGGILLGLG